MLINSVFKAISARTYLSLCEKAVCWISLGYSLRIMTTVYSREGLIAGIRSRSNASGSRDGSNLSCTSPLVSIRESACAPV